MMLKKYIKGFIFVALQVLILGGCSGYVIVEDIRGSKLEKANREETKDSILIIDSRQEQLYNRGHIPNAINIPVAALQERIDELEKWKDKDVYVYAENNDESFKACKILVSNGHKNIFNADGIEQYKYKNTVRHTFVTGHTFTELAKNPDSVIIDCRSVNSYNAGHISGAISIPIAEIETRLPTLPKDKKILLYCANGTNSSKAGELLSKYAFMEIYCSIEGTSEYKFDLVE